MNPKGEDMSSVAVFADKIVREVMLEEGVKKPRAREIVAEGARFPGPGTLENLAKGKLKYVGLIENGLKQYAARRIRAKAAALEHDLFVARALAGGASNPDLDAAETHLRAVREALGK